MSDQPVIDAPFRIAFRAEGKMINAYFAPKDSMDDALLMGSISKRLCDEDRALWEGFKDLMRQSITSLMKATLGIEPVGFGEEPAPESERSGSA